MQKILIRADGSTQIGLGHLVRCLALGQMLQEHFEIRFFCKEIPVGFLNEIVQKGISVAQIQDESHFFNQIEKGQIVVLDGYSFGIEYQKEIKNRGAKLICIEDFINKDSLADLILNHAPGISAADYKAQPYTQFALGVEFALLRPSFLAQARKERKIEKIETVLICFGGGDFKNFTEKVLKEVVEFKQFKKIIAVTGAAYSFVESLAAVVNIDDRVEHRHAISEEEMLKTILECELAIVPASGILTEVLTLKSVIVSGIYIENQQFVYQNYKKQGCFFDAGNFDDAEVKKAIESALAQPKSAAPIDGNSNKRIKNIFENIASFDRLELKPIEKSDLELTYSWAINPVIRAFSFSTHQITKEEHQNWFFQKTEDPNCVFFIAYLAEKPIGSIRFDVKAGEAIISYLLSPDFHGKGYGQMLLVKGLLEFEKEAARRNLAYHSVIGYVMPQNIPSVKAFERAGYEKVNEGERFRFKK